MSSLEAMAAVDGLCIISSQNSMCFAKVTLAAMGTSKELGWVWGSVAQMRQEAWQSTLRVMMET